MTKMTQVLGYVCGSVGSLISCAAGPVMIQKGGHPTYYQKYYQGG